MNIVVAKNELDTKIANEALKSDKQLEKLIQTIESGQRRDRQHAAAAINIISKTDADVLGKHIDTLIDGLNRPEAQTRWELLEAMATLVDIDEDACGKAIPEAEAALFDEESGSVRLGAMRFLCKLGATSEERSEQTWPLIDEAIQCYHGDLEFNDMLNALIDFSKGSLSDDVKAALKDRMSFDAANAKGTLKRRAQTIIDNLEGTKSE